MNQRRKNKMGINNTNNEDRPKEVLTRFRPSELEIMKADTGNERDGSAVAAYARKRLREQLAQKELS